MAYETTISLHSLEKKCVLFVFVSFRARASVRKRARAQGYFELDWNEDFVGLLGEAGYAGETPEQIVDLWFNDLCRSVAADAAGEDL